MKDHFFEPSFFKIPSKHDSDGILRSENATNQPILTLQVSNKAF